MTRYLTLVEILYIHDDQIRIYGGTQGVRDMGLIEAALFRPQTGYYTDLVQEAAALWESLSQNHPFVDGNKRVAFAATDTFLAFNGLWIDSDSDEAHEFVMPLYESGTFSFSALEAWLRPRVREF